MIFRPIFCAGLPLFSKKKTENRENFGNSNNYGQVGEVVKFVLLGKNLCSSELVL